MKTFNEVINESSLSRVHSHVQHRNIGMITASRGENTAQENKANNKALETEIRSHGYGVIHVKGRYVENHGSQDAKTVEEHSLLVVGKKGDDNGHLLHHLKRLGEKYKQDSILHKKHDEDDAHLHGTKEGVWPEKGKSHNVGKFHPNRAGEFHTAMKGNRTFSFEEGFVPDYSSIKFTIEKSFFSREETEF